MLRRYSSGKASRKNASPWPLAMATETAAPCAAVVLLTAHKVCSDRPSEALTIQLQADNDCVNEASNGNNGCASLCSEYRKVCEY